MIRQKACLFKNKFYLCNANEKRMHNTVRKCGWVAETTSLLNWRTGYRTGGSNPPASASTRRFFKEESPFFMANPLKQKGDVSMTHPLPHSVLTIYVWLECVVDTHTEHLVRTAIYIRAADNSRVSLLVIRVCRPEIGNVHLQMLIQVNLRSEA